jgi:undecaprenyl diphosphate synthase
MLALLLAVAAAAVGLALLLPRLPRLTTPLARRILRALRRGTPPAAIAFIMDGNRRWARARTLPPSAGHPRGGDALADTLQWCLDAGVACVTVYAFSTENFKRPPAEVAEIFALAETRVRRMLDETDLVQRHRVRVNVLGDMSALPPRLRATFARAMAETRAFSGGPTLNVCFAYTARAEMAAAVGTAVRLCDAGALAPSDIDEHLLAACLHTGVVRDAGAAAPDTHAASAADAARDHQAAARARLGFPDLVVRTSGEIRLSDFLLMQASDAVLSFEPVLWPDLTAWHMVRIILDYQAQRRAQARAARAATAGLSCSLPPHSPNFASRRVQSAVESVRRDYYARVDADALLAAA